MKFWGPYLLTWLVVILVIIVGGRMHKHQSRIVIPRADRPGVGNELGATIVRNICTVCGETDFYQGQSSGIYHWIYCGNKKCRQGYMVANYGPGNIWAQHIGEKGPPEYYD